MTGRDPLRVVIGGRDAPARAGRRPTPLQEALALVEAWLDQPETPSAEAALRDLVQRIAAALAARDRAASGR